MPKRVLLAGYGDLASRLATRLLARGDAVFGLRRSEAPMATGVIALRGDLLEPQSLEMLNGEFDSVVCTLTPDQRDAEGYRRTYVQAPLNLARAKAVASAHWIFASSTAVYGGDTGQRVDDDTPPVPDEFNGRLLLEAESALAGALGRISALRFTGIYGPGRRMLLRRVASGAVARPRWTNRIHSEDAAAAIEFVLDRPELSGPLIVSDGCPAREDEVMRWLAERMGCPEPALSDEPEGGRKIFPKRLFAAGFRPQYRDFRLGYSSLLRAGE